MEENRRELVSSLSYEIVRDVAPDELDLFEDFKEEFFHNPDAFLEIDPRKREQMLGFGGDIAGQFITAGVFPLIWSVVSYIAMAGIGSFKEAMAKKVERKVKETIEGKKEALPHDTIREVREYAFKNALTLGMDKQKAAIIADALIGKLKQMKVV